MSDVPTLVKVLTYLRSNTAPKAYNDIISAVKEGQALVDRALNKLMAEGIGETRDNCYCYVVMPRSEELCQKLFALYGEVTVEPRLELLARGLLCQATGHYLLRVNTFLGVLEEEGFTREEVIQFLEAEIERGYVKGTRGISGARVSILPPLFVPSYYASRQTKAREYQRLDEWFCGWDLSSGEEDYLIGLYPAELAETAIRNLEMKRPGLSQALKRDAFRQWYMSNDPDTRLR